MTVSDDEVAEAMVLLLERSKLVVEGAGAAAAAAILHRKVRAPSEGETCAVLSGGNVDAGRLVECIRLGETAAGRRAVLVTVVPDRPGALAGLLRIAAEGGANVLDVAHLREGIDLHVRETAIRLVLQTDGPEHRDRVIESICAEGFHARLEHTALPTPSGAEEAVNAHADLRDALAEVSDLASGAALMHWDERTKMPAAGRARPRRPACDPRPDNPRAPCLGRPRAVSSTPRARSSTAPIRTPTRRASSGFRPASGRRHGASPRSCERRWLERSRSPSTPGWRPARKNDFSQFLPHLEKLVDLKRRYIECFEVEHPYDALLDDFEPDASTPTVAGILARLRSGLAPLVERRGSGGRHRQRLPARRLPGGAPAGLAQELAGSMPFEPATWRLDDTTHPFATSISRADVRLTTRYDASYLGTAIWSVIHEAGHGLYEAGMPDGVARTPAAAPRSLGLHESQSRLWENWVGRSRAYMGPLLARLRSHFPDSFDSVEADELYRAANVVRRSLIRVEADELTYNLHVAIRFELELELFEEKLDVADLPEAWNARYRDYLGLDVPDDAHGVLQDVHWAGGAFGYFPTYSLGNVIAAQLWERAVQDVPELDAQLAEGELEPLHAWLRENLFRHAGKFDAAATVERVVGSPIDPAPLVAHLEAKFGDLYR